MNYLKILFLSVLCTVFILSVQGLPAHADQWCSQTVCSICDTPLSIKNESSGYGDDFYFPRGGYGYDYGYITCGNLLVDYFAIKDNPICANCLNKYQANFKSIIKDFFEHRRIENKDLILKHETDKQNKESTALENEIKSLEKQIRILKGEETEADLDPYNMHGFLGIITGTDLTSTVITDGTSETYIVDGITADGSVLIGQDWLDYFLHKFNCLDETDDETID